jgi:hypothetical protein
METCYKAFRREVIQSIPLRSNRFGFEPEVTAKLARRCVRVYETSISYYGRTYAEGKKITWRDGLKLDDGTIYAATSPHGDVFRWVPEASGVDGQTPVARPGVAAVIGNVPNPLAGSTSIRWQIPSDGQVRLTILDVQGRRVRTLLEERRPAGQHEIPWNAYDDKGTPVESGVYFACLDAGGSVTFQKLIVLR